MIAFGADLLSVYSKAKESDPIYKQKKLELKEEKYSVSRARANVFLPKVAILASKKERGRISACNRDLVLVGILIL